MRKHPYKFRTLASFVFSLCLFGCGTDRESQSLVASTEAKDCSAKATALRARLGETARFTVTMPADMKGPLAWKRVSRKHIGDATGGLRFAADAFPLKGSFSAVAEASLTQSFLFSYVADPAGANQEIRYVEQYPGTVVETVELTDTQGKSCRREVSIKLSPATP